MLSPALSPAGLQGRGAARLQPVARVVVVTAAHGGPLHGRDNGGGHVDRVVVAVANDGRGSVDEAVINRLLVAAVAEARPMVLGRRGRGLDAAT